MKIKYIKHYNHRIFILLFLIMVLFLIILVGYNICFGSKKLNSDDVSVKISYLGDIGLSDNVVSSSYNKLVNKYDFDYIFSGVKDTFRSSDYVLGFFNSNVSNYSAFEDFFDSVSKNGSFFFDVDDNLDIKKSINKSGGFYNNSNMNILKVKGIKIGIFSYNSCVSNCNSKNDIVPKSDDTFMDVKNNVISSIKDGLGSADYIFVMNDMKGFKASDVDVWNDIFSSLNVDVVFNNGVKDKIFNKNSTLFINSITNFLNDSSVNNNTVITEFDVSVKNGIKNISVYPLYDSEHDGKKFKVYISDIFADNFLKEKYNFRDLKEIDDLLKDVTYKYINKRLGTSKLQKKYMVLNDKYYDFNLKRALNNGGLKNVLSDASSFVFIGDSITAGSANNGHGWYEPISSMYPNTKVYNISHGGYTTKDILNKFSNKIKDTNGDVYFIALGINDIRKRDNSSSLSGKEYISNIDEIIKLIPNKNAEIVLVAPWRSMINDIKCKYDFYDRDRMINEFSDYLKKYVKDNGYIYSNPNSYIDGFIDKNNAYMYYVDFIHPNKNYGIKLYSYAVLLNSKHY